MAVTMVVPPLLSVILGKRDGGTTLPMVVTKWCTAVHLAVYTITNGDRHQTAT